MNDELRYRLFKTLEVNPEISQRELADELGISLGKANYCLRALMSKGWVKAGNFRRNPNKRAYTYFLTPKGLREKAGLTVRFLKVKVAEYERLEKQIAELRREAERVRGPDWEAQE
jgi:EPS-associated MarR family transcriptional regulator